MPILLHQFILHSAEKFPHTTALRYKDESLNYESLAAEVISIGQGLLSAGILAGERIATFLPKRLEAVIGLFSSSYAGAVFVPINPLLKPHQVAYILKDCNVRVLITSHNRMEQLAEVLNECHDLALLVDTDNKAPTGDQNHFRIQHWKELKETQTQTTHRRIDVDVCAILYTSGSTGKPKGVVLSHQNMVLGAKSVCQYLHNTAHDRLLAILPLSFDYGLSQLTTAFCAGASVTLLDYLLPRDVLIAISKHQITGLAGVPTVWTQLCGLQWPENNSLRYICNSGGALPSNTLNKLKQQVPQTDIYLMYGLTEAFRSTYLSPEDIERKPTSIGKAIPNAEILVLRKDGSICDPDEPGELVHRGSLVALGYWNQPEKTAAVFKPLRIKHENLSVPEIAVWSGDKVKRDKDGYLFFIARNDDMIKTSGYRVSPSEIESVIYATGRVSEVVAFGAPHPKLGAAIVCVVQSTTENIADLLLTTCKKELPNFMQPAHIAVIDSMPKNPNGKIDRHHLAKQFNQLFSNCSIS